MKKIALVLLVVAGFSAVSEESKGSHEVEVSIIRTGGNSFVETQSLATKSKMKWGSDNIGFGGHYILGVSEQEDGSGNKNKSESARNWDVYGRYERDFNEKLAGYFQAQVEGDKFKGFTQRENFDLGTKYSFLKSEERSLSAEFGFRHTIEKLTAKNADGEDRLSSNKARLYGEYAKKVKEGLSYKFWMEYLPNFTNSNDYIINFEPSLAMDLSTTLALKLAYKGSYDNEPAVPTNKKLDYTYTTSLLASF